MCSDSLLFCRASSGSGPFLALIITADVSVGTTTGLASYDGEVIDGLLPGLINPRYRSNFATTGSLSITVAGRNFGTNFVSLRARGGYTTCDFSTWISDTSVQCYLRLG